MKKFKSLTNKKRFCRVEWECAFCWNTASGSVCSTCGRTKADTQFAVSDFTEREAKMADKAAKIEEEEELWQVLEM